MGNETISELVEGRPSGEIAEGSAFCCSAFSGFGGLAACLLQAVTRTRESSGRKEMYKRRGKIEFLNIQLLLCFGERRA
jgi:hypothetical protein